MTLKENIPATGACAIQEHTVNSICMKATHPDSKKTGGGRGVTRHTCRPGARLGLLLYAVSYSEQP